MLALLITALTVLHAGAARVNHDTEHDEDPILTGLHGLEEDGRSNNSESVTATGAHRRRVVAGLNRDASDGVAAGMHRRRVIVGDGHATTEAALAGASHSLAEQSASREHSEGSDIPKEVTMACGCGNEVVRLGYCGKTGWSSETASIYLLGEKVDKVWKNMTSCTRYHPGGVQYEKCYTQDRSCKFSSRVSEWCCPLPLQGEGAHPKKVPHSNELWSCNHDHMRKCANSTKECCCDTGFDPTSDGYCKERASDEYWGDLLDREALRGGVAPRFGVATWVVAALAAAGSSII